MLIVNQPGICSTTTTMEVLVPVHYTHHTHHTCYTYNTYIPDIWDKCSNNSEIHESRDKSAVLSSETKVSQLDNEDTRPTQGCEHLETYKQDQTDNQKMMIPESHDEDGNQVRGGALTDELNVEFNQNNPLSPVKQDSDLTGGLMRTNSPHNDDLHTPLNQSTEKGTAHGEQNVASASECADTESTDKLNVTSETVVADKIPINLGSKPKLERKNARLTPTIAVAPLFSHDSTLRNRTPRDESQARNDAANMAIVPALYCPSRMFKVVFIGDSGVGKTSFIHRASVGEFRSDFGATVGVDYRTVELRVGNVLAVLQLWDTAGQERFRSITRQYYRSADGVVVMYDLTCERSFINVVDWVSSVKETAGDEVVVLVLGNKQDLYEHHYVNLNTVHKVAKANDCYVHECSAATGYGVQDAMMQMVNLLINRNNGDADPTSIRLQEPIKKKTCCK